MVLLVQEEEKEMEQMTKLALLYGPVYTTLSPEEVRSYLHGGVKTGVIDGFEDEAGLVPIYINISAIEYIYH